MCRLTVGDCNIFFKKEGSRAEWGTPVVQATWEAEWEDGLRPPNISKPCLLKKNYIYVLYYKLCVCIYLKKEEGFQW